MKMKVTIIRHGRTQGNTERRYIGGRTDEPLSGEGRAELSEITDSDVRLFVSPMKRARETAEILFPGAHPVVISELREMDFGVFEGKNYSELDGNPDYQAWIDSGGAMQIPGGESMESFRKRSTEGLRKAAALSPQESEIYIIAHGGTVMAVMSALTGEDYYDFYSGNGCGFTIDLEVDDAGNIISAGTYDRFCGGVRT